MSQYRFSFTGISQETFITFVFISFWILVSIVTVCVICDKDLPTQLGLATGIFGVAAILLSLIVKDLLNTYSKKGQSTLPAEDKQLEDIENSVLTLEESLSKFHSSSKSEDIDDAIKRIKGIRKRILTVREAVGLLKDLKLRSELVSASIKVVLEDNQNPLELYYTSPKEQKKAKDLFNKNLLECVNWVYESLKWGAAMGDKNLKKALVKPPIRLYILALEAMQVEIRKRCIQKPEIANKINTYIQILIVSLSH